MKANVVRLVETKARDALRTFLLSRKRKPLDVFLSEFLGQGRPALFQNVDLLEMPTEEIVHTFEWSGKRTSTGRSDLTIKRDRHVLVVEIKVGAEESLNQYDKYKAAYEQRGYKTTVVGLINRMKAKARIKDHEPFLREYKRVLWSDLLKAFSREFAETPEFLAFTTRLQFLDRRIGQYQRSCASVDIVKSVELLGRNTQTLHSFYQDFSKRLKGYIAVPFQAGSTGYELHIGKAAWAQSFNEPRFHRISLALNPYSTQIKRLHEEPYFAFCVVLWNRSTFKNIDSFMQRGSAFARHLRSKGFEVVRNRDGWKKGNMAWEHPFATDPKMCFANAFWEHRFSLPRSQFIKLTWENLQIKLLEEFQKLSAIVETMGSTGRFLSESESVSL